jgi:hypothetical protein
LNIVLFWNFISILLCVSLYIIIMAAAFSTNTTRGIADSTDIAALFGTPPNTPCRLEKGIYEIKTHDRHNGYLFKITPVTSDGTGIYSITAPAPDEILSSYKSTPIGTVKDLDSLIHARGYHIINGPGIDVGGMIIHIERDGESTSYKLICDTSPATGGRGPYKQLTITHPRSRRRGRGCRRGSRRGRGRGRCVTRRRRNTRRNRKN